MSTALLESRLTGLGSPRRGKVREVYDLGDHLLMVASDRISAFDVVMDEGVPDKGKVLTQMSAYWFSRLEPLAPHHMVSTTTIDLEAVVGRDLGQVAGRSMIVRKTVPIMVECVARGYLAGSWWKDYAQGLRSIHGIELPDGLRNGAKLPHPIFTPATKNEVGHDENISFEQMVQVVGDSMAAWLQDTTLKLYASAAAHCESVGLVLADTKFEFGLTPEGPIWIDEALTPDSSRYWPAGYEIGQSPPSFDKQYLRDYLETCGWGKTPPPPPLPPEVILGTRAKYLEAYRRITGHDLDI